ncbi:uncharacterized protein [Diadema antillarum]
MAGRREAERISVDWGKKEYYPANSRKDAAEILEKPIFTSKLKDENVEVSTGEDIELKFEVVGSRRRTILVQLERPRETCVKDLIELHKATNEEGKVRRIVTFTVSNANQRKDEGNWFLKAWYADSNACDYSRRNVEFISR